MKVTVIVPAYNSEKFILKCIKSILNQTYNNIELIIIDDGSTDKTYEICSRFSALDDRIKIYRQDNHGVSSARNVGLQKATGDYIMFVDSDDYIDKNTIEKGIDVIKQFKVDIVKYNFKKKISHMLINNHPFFEKDVLIQKPFEKIMNNLFDTDNYCSSCGCLINSKIAKKTKFNEEVFYGEDFLYFINILLLSKSIYIINKPMYYYVFNNNSITNSCDYSKIINCISQLLDVVEQITRSVKEQIRISINPRIKLERNIHSFFYMVYQLDGIKGIEKLYNIIKENSYISEKLRFYEIDLDKISTFSINQKILIKVKKIIKKIVF